MCITPDAFQFYSKNTDTHIDQTGDRSEFRNVSSGVRRETVFMTKE